MESTKAQPVVNGALPLNAGTDPAASSEPKRTRGCRTRGKKKPRPRIYPYNPYLGIRQTGIASISVDFRSTGSSNLGRPASQSVPTSYGPSSHKRQNDDNSGDGREKKKARYAEIETKVNGLRKELEGMKDSLARIDEKRKIKESRHLDSESLTQDPTDLKGLRKEMEELKDFVARSVAEMKKDQESRHGDSVSSPKDATIAESTGDEKRIKKENIS